MIQTGIDLTHRQGFVTSYITIHTNILCHIVDRTYGKINQFKCINWDNTNIIISCNSQTIQSTNRSRYIIYFYFFIQWTFGKVINKSASNLANNYKLYYYRYGMVNSQVLYIYIYLQYRRVHCSDFVIYTNMSINGFEYY